METSKESRRSWVFLCGVSFVTFIEAGIMKSFGVLLPVLTEQYDSSEWVLGLYATVIVGWGYTLGLAAEAFVKVFGPRFVIMVGGVIFSTGLFFCAFAQTVSMLFVGQFMTGFLLLQTNVATGIIPEYFDEHFNAAVSIFCCTCSLGVIVMPLVTQVLLEAYGLRGTFIMLAALSLHTVLCGALHRPQQQDSDSGDEESQMVTSREERQQLIQAENTCLTCYPDSPPSTMESLSIFINVRFITLVIVTSTVLGYVQVGWLIYIVSFALSQGLTSYQSSVIASFGGIGMLASKVALPELNKTFTYKQLMYVSSLTTAVFLTLTTSLKSYVGLCAVSLFYGTGAGILSPEIYIATKDVVGNDHYVTGVAISHTFYGLSSLGSGFATGLFYDVTSTFHLSFAILSAVSLLTAVSLGLESTWQRLQESRD